MLRSAPARSSSRALTPPGGSPLARACAVVWPATGRPDCPPPRAPRWGTPGTAGPGPPVGSGTARVRWGAASGSGTGPAAPAPLTTPAPGGPARRACRSARSGDRRRSAERSGVMGVTPDHTAPGTRPVRIPAGGARRVVRSRATDRRGSGADQSDQARTGPPQPASPSRTVCAAHGRGARTRSRGVGCAAARSGRTRSAVPRGGGTPHGTTGLGTPPPGPPGREVAWLPPTGARRDRRDLLSGTDVPPVGGTGGEPGPPPDPGGPRSHPVRRRASPTPGPRR